MADALAEPLRQALGEALKQLLAVLGALLALLLDLDDLKADEPVGMDDGRVDGARDAAAGLVEDGGDALVEALFGGGGELAHGGPCRRVCPVVKPRASLSQAWTWGPQRRVGTGARPTPTSW
jgi:hypothetical protein